MPIAETLSKPPQAGGDATLSGLTTAYEERGRGELLSAAPRAAGWSTAYLPADRVPRWDFNAPNLPDAPSDASAMAIAGCGLYRLARDAGQARAKYQSTADALLKALCNDYLSNDRSGAIRTTLHDARTCLSRRSVHSRSWVP